MEISNDILRLWGYHKVGMLKLSDQELWRWGCRARRHLVAARYEASRRVEEDHHAVMLVEREVYQQVKLTRPPKGQPWPEDQEYWARIRKRIRDYKKTQAKLYTDVYRALRKEYADLEAFDPCI